MPSTHRALLAAALLTAAGCTPPDPGRSRPEPDPTAPSAAVYTGPRTEAVATPATLEQSGRIDCAEPELRTGDHFRTRQSAALPTTGKRLWGAGMVVADFTGDGWLDMLLLGETSHGYWVGQPHGDPNLSEPIQQPAPWLAGIDLDFAVGGTAADLDGDGWLDLVITRWQAPNRILRNLGGTGFEDITPPALLANAARTQSASVGDLDGDGDLDLFFGNYAIDPDDAFEPPMDPAEPAELYRNDGGGQWTDLSERLPQPVHDGYTFASGLYDLDGDGLPEIVVSNDFGKEHPSAIAWNHGAMDFTADTAWHPDVEDMGLAVGDLNGDLVPDFLITSWRTISLLLSGDALGIPGTWVDGAAAAGIEIVHEPPLRRDFGWGVELGDVDNDADLDAIAVFGDWEQWTSDLLEIDALWVQTASAPLTFEDRAEQPEWDLADDRDGRSVVLADLNGDGWLDVVKRNVNQLSRMHLSHCGSESWLRVELASTGANTRGIGATVVVEVAGERQIRWIGAGSTGLYTGQPPEAHFGLGGAEVVDRLEVRWPDGEVDVFEDVATRQRVRAVRR